MGFMGSSESTFDSKGRISLPVKYRKSLTADGTDPKGSELELYVTLSFDNAIRVYTEDEFYAYRKSLFADEVNGEARFNRNNVDERRMFALVNAYSASTTIDTAGRISVPSRIREKAQIDRLAVLDGSGDYLEIWDPGRRDAFLAGEDVGGLLNGLIALREERVAGTRQALHGAEE